MKMNNIVEEEAAHGAKCQVDNNDYGSTTTTATALETNEDLFKKLNDLESHWHTVNINDIGRRDSDLETMNLTASFNEVAHEDMNMTVLEENVVEEEEDDNNDSSSSTTTSMWNNKNDITGALAICICCFTNAYLLISPFPYAGYMSMHLLPNITTLENTGKYAGMISSSYMFGRATSSYTWGRLSDVLGRKITLLMSLVLSAICSIWFGISTSYTNAIISRFVLGACSCIMITTKTYTSELAHGRKELETKLMGFITGMRGWGFLISPGLSGILSDPIKQFPSIDSWHSRIPNKLKDVLLIYPYILPNIVAAVFCMISFMFVYYFLEETLPHTSRRSLSGSFHSMLQDSFYSTAQLPSQQELNSTDIGYNESQPLVLQLKHTNTKPSTTNTRTTMQSIWSVNSTRTYLLLYWSWSFVVISFDEAFPLFCISSQSGLGLTEVMIGKILSFSGIIYVLFQYGVYSLIVNYFGVTGSSLTLTSLLGIPFVIFLPFALYLNRDNDNTATPLSTNALIFLSMLLGITRIFSSAFFANISIALNRSASMTNQRGAMNGLSMTGASIVKGLGPLFTGYGIAFVFSCPYFIHGDEDDGFYYYLRSFIVFGVISFGGLFVCISTLCI